jgi:hypothetical protein
MTSRQGKRCRHCQAGYVYQASGPGCGDRLNDDRYCPQCKAVIVQALSALPVLFQCRYFPVSEVPEYADVTREQVEQWEADFQERRKTQVLGQRIWPGLFDMETGDQYCIRQVRATSGPHQGTPFRFSSWHNKPEHLIEVGLEWDLTQQKRGGVWRE